MTTISEGDLQTTIPEGAVARKAEGPMPCDWGVLHAQKSRDGSRKNNGTGVKDADPVGFQAASISLKP